MEIPTKEQLFEKYMRLVEKKGYYKDCNEEQKKEKNGKS